MRRAHVGAVHLCLMLLVNLGCDFSVSPPDMCWDVIGPMCDPDYPKNLPTQPVLRVTGFPYDRVDHSRHVSTASYVGVLHVGESTILTLEGQRVSDVVAVEWFPQDPRLARVEPTSATTGVFRALAPGQVQTWRLGGFAVFRDHSRQAAQLWAKDPATASYSHVGMIDILP